MPGIHWVIMPRISPSPSPSPTASLPELLLIGCSGSGKTVLVRAFRRHVATKQLQQSASVTASVSAIDEMAAEVNADTLPTNGVERDIIECNGTRFVIKEIGGSMQPTWPSYYAAATAAIFVIDISDPAHFSSGMVELCNLITHQQMKEKLILILLNKCDSPFALKRSEVRSFLRLDDIITWSNTQARQQTQQAAEKDPSSSSPSAAPQSLDAASSPPSVSSSPGNDARIRVLECSGSECMGIERVMDEIVSMVG